MGTRARIAVKRDDGKFASIYTHWDGYPSHHGPILLDHYNTADKVEQLIALGDISSLDTTIESTVAYARDRGETDVEAVKSGTLQGLSQLTQETGGEYLYVFQDGAWFAAAGGVSAFGLPATKEPGALLPLADVIASEAQ